MLYPLSNRILQDAKTNQDAEWGGTYYLAIFGEARTDQALKLPRPTTFQTFMNIDFRFLIYDAMINGHIINISKRKNQSALTSLMEACLYLKAEIE